MIKNIFFFALPIMILLFCETGFSFVDRNFYLGAAYFSENSLGKETQSATGAVGSQGTATFLCY
jgi:hypothetical protein